jgi:hypothetical protein
MSSSPFSARPAASPDEERRRSRLVVLIAALGITATLLAYAASPSVRHAVHSVKHAVVNVVDHDEGKKAPGKTHATPTTPARSPQQRHPASTTSTR